MQSCDQLRRPWQLDFLDRLSGAFLDRFGKGVRDCDELSGDCCDDNLVWFSGGTKTISEDLQDRVVMVGDEGRLVDVLSKKDCLRAALHGAYY
ncbi:MAG: hypothetical protein C0524_10555 [Rhodobacter sp.]|nr:hypothetical protein [Rhodobacter sp.]